MEVKVPPSRKGKSPVQRLAFGSDNEPKKPKERHEAVSLACGSYPGGSDTQDTRDRKDNVVRIREKRKKVTSYGVRSVYI